MDWLSRIKPVLFLLFAGLLIVHPANAETRIGTVVSIGEEQFILREMPEEAAEKTVGEVQVIFVPATQRGRFSDGPAFPRCVRVGKTIHLDGRFDVKKNVFLAKKIRGWPGTGKHHDPTGVRARLGRCRNTSGAP